MIRNKKKKVNQIDMSSLLDIIFILLVFVMVSISFQKQFASMELDLPEAKGSSQETSKTEIKISITNQEIIYKNEIALSRDKLLTEIHSGDFKNKAVLLNVEKKVTYDYFFSILNALKSAEIQKLELGIKEK
jgi:biopolymer transport protein ExbD